MVTVEGYLEYQFIPQHALLESPTSEGFYWYQSSPTSRPEIVRVSREGTGLIKWYYYRTGDSHPYVLEPGRGRWAYCRMV